MFAAADVVGQQLGFLGRGSLVCNFVALIAVVDGDDVALLGVFDPFLVGIASEAPKGGSGTDGFSFAYLKELFLSAMIRWMKSRETGGMGALLREQLHGLRAQMTTA